MNHKLHITIDQTPFKKRAYPEVARTDEFVEIESEEGGSLVECDHDEGWYLGKREITLPFQPYKGLRLIGLFGDTLPLKVISLRWDVIEERWLCIGRCELVIRKGASEESLDARFPGWNWNFIDPDES
jgi:hypothetical protein